MGWMLQASRTHFYYLTNSRIITTTLATMGKFERKYNDCLSIVIQERSRLGLPALPDLAWVYEQYPAVESHPPNLVAELLERYCKRRESGIQHGDLLCLRMGNEANLGMAYKVEEEIWGIYANENGAAREPLHRRIIRCVESVWFLA